MAVLSPERLLEIAQYSFMRLDGAWFLALAEKLGVETAFQIDVEAWKRFSYLLGKRLRQVLAPEPVWPESFLEALDVLCRLMRIEGRQVTVAGRAVTIRTSDCEVQRMIAKAGVADCGVATVQTYQGLAQGLFGREADVSVDHLKNLNRGDDCCEVIVTWEGPAGKR